MTEENLLELETDDPYLLMQLTRDFHIKKGHKEEE